mmetsp:Transcript_5447/g.19680  ORF Transcript_5447/g.19680 Transcript_5447/m.19680 type:complete len:216 (+) Transcript_5447:731-1378(+)
MSAAATNATGFFPLMIPLACAKSRSVFASPTIGASALETRDDDAPPPPPPSSRRSSSAASTPPPSLSSGIAAAARATNAPGSSCGTSIANIRRMRLYTLPTAKTSAWHAAATSRIAIGNRRCRHVAYTHAARSNVVQSPSPHLPSLARVTSASASAAASAGSLSCVAAKRVARAMSSRCVASASRNIRRATDEAWLPASVARAALRWPPRAAASS